MADREAQVFWKRWERRCFLAQVETTPIRLTHTHVSRSKDFIFNMVLGRNLCDLLHVLFLEHWLLLSEKVGAWRDGLKGCWPLRGGLPGHGRGPDRSDW